MTTQRLYTVFTALFVLLVGNVQAFWRMECRARSGVARIDPLVSNGTVSEHVHVIHGSSGFSETSGYDELMAGECTSCTVAQDKSAYWTPGLYFQDAATGEFELVPQVGGMLAYYLLYPNAGNTSIPNVTAFPAGFEMIAGDTNQRNFTYPVPDIPKSDWTGVYETQDFLRQAALGFNCLNYSPGVTPEGSLYRHFLPDKAYLDANCLDGVRFELMFPSCWNRSAGNAPPDKKSHVAYPSEVMTGNCPDGFPERLPSLFYETIWNTYAYVGVAGQFVIANGDPTGYGYHGDFIMGWDEAFLQDAVNTCINPDGEIESCPLFDLQDPSVYGNCNFTMPAALINENVVDPVGSLPGNPPILSGPGYAMGATAGETTATPIPVPTLSYSAGQSVSSGSDYVPGAIFAAKETVSSSSPVQTTPVQTSATSTITTAPSIASAANTESFFSTEYSTSGQEVFEILWVEELITVTAPQSTTTVYIPGRKRHVHQHQQRGRHLV